MKATRPCAGLDSAPPLRLRRPGRRAVRQRNLGAAGCVATVEHCRELDISPEVRKAPTNPDGDPRGDVTRWSIHATAKAAESVFFGRLDYSIEYFMMFDEMFELNSAKYVGF